MPPQHYHIRVLRIARRHTAAPRPAAGPAGSVGWNRPAGTGTRRRTLSIAGVIAALALLGACGEPPAPPLTAPPEEPGNASSAASAPPPSGAVPGLPATVPAPGLPTAGATTYPPVYPAYPTYPTNTTPPTTATTTSPATPGPSPAP